MKDKEQIEIAEKMINNLEDYVVLAKAQRKLKVESVDKQIDNVTNFVQSNVDRL